ncbi:MAG: heme o synthase [Planctomycetales bacterium]|nr:heme o synthase [Planctomycetales bacterium]
MSTSATGIAISRDRPQLAFWTARVRDYLQLAKPRITILELVTAVAGMYLASYGAIPLEVAAATLVGAGMLAVSANTLNQYLERRLDARMKRTADRPLPTGRLTPTSAAVFGFFNLALGMTVLVLGVNWTTAILGLVSWLLYVAVYTPLKVRTPFNTTIGAVSGAIPIVMGWTAAGGALDATALGLFGVVFFWQYPHFMAIAWLCREDYTAAGYQMDSVVEPTGARAGAIAVAGAAMLLPVAVLPAIRTPFSAQEYLMVAASLNALLILVAGMFLLRRNDRSARRLLRASLLYLPAWMLALCWLGC